MMLTSNWDNKDVRDVARGSNTAIFEHRLPDGRRRRATSSSTGAPRWAAGAAGFRAKWDSEAFEAQTPEFIPGVDETTSSVGLPRAAHRRGHRGHHGRGRALALPLRRPHHRRANPRGPARQRRHRRGGRLLHARPARAHRPTPPRRRTRRRLHARGRVEQIAVESTRDSRCVKTAGVHGRVHRVHGEDKLLSLWPLCVLRELRVETNARQTSTAKSGSRVFRNSRQLAAGRGADAGGVVCGVEVLEEPAAERAVAERVV